MILTKREVQRFLFSIFILSVLFACVQSIDYTKVEIPELLRRGEQIQLGAEWDQVQNTYAALSHRLNSNHSDVKAALELAQLFVKEARITGEHGHYYNAALQVIDGIPQLNDINPDDKFLALLTKAGIQLSLHDFWAALETGTTALLLNRNNAQVYGVLVDAYVELGNYEKAVEMADIMMSIKPDIRSYSRVSYLRQIHGNYEGAIQAMTMAVKAGLPGSEENAWAMQTLGELYLTIGEVEKAQGIFEEIIKIRDQYPFAIAGLGHIALEQNQLDVAGAITQQAMDIIPEVGFYTQMAKIYKRQGRQVEYQLILEEIFEMLEDDVIHGHNMNMEYADIYSNILDDQVQALSFISEEYNNRPDNIDVNFMLADIYYKQGNFIQAEEHIQKASRTESKNPDLLGLIEKIDRARTLSAI